MPENPEPTATNGSGPTRRTLLGGMALGGMTLGAGALALSACSSTASGLVLAKDNSKSQKSMRWDGRAIYKDLPGGREYPIIGRFETVTKILVTYTDDVRDDNIYYSRVKHGLAKGSDIGADAFVASDWMVDRLIRLGYLRPFNHAAMPNLKNMQADLKAADFDPGRKFSIPWNQGFTGIAWKKSEFPGGLDSVSQLWDPALRGKVGVMADMRDSLGLIMLDQGVDISGDWGDSEFAAAVAELRGQLDSGQVHGVKGSAYRSDLENGVTVASMARSNDILQLNREHGDQWGFALPQKGGTLWCDNAVVPLGSSHAINAEIFINYYYDPGNATEAAETAGFVSPLSLDTQITDAGIDTKQDILTLTFPDAEILAQVRKFRTLGHDEELRYLAQFQTALLSAS